jgi:hypothetical protein
MEGKLEDGEGNLTSAADKQASLKVEPLIKRDFVRLRPSL